MVARVGDWDTETLETTRPQDYTVVKFATHPNASGSHPANDLALLGTSPPIRLGRGVGPACLPACRDQFAAGTQCWLVGWSGAGGRQRKVRLARTDMEGSGVVAVVADVAAAALVVYCLFSEETEVVCVSPVGKDHSTSVVFFLQMQHDHLVGGHEGV